MLLAIDPGATTGAVFLNGGPLYEQLVSYMSLQHYGVRPLLARAASFPELQHVVIERPPVSGHDTQLLGIVAIMEQHFAGRRLPVSFMSPGEWKPVAKTLAMTPPRHLSRHERDAWKMAHVWARTRKE